MLGHFYSHIALNVWNKLFTNINVATCHIIFTSLIEQELELYKDELLQKPAVLALNKIDIEGSDRVLEEVLNQLKDIPG